MNPSELTLLVTLIAAIAVLYSCVGHGGASGYIAIMMFFGLIPAVIKPTALILNILVSSIAAFQFYKAGYFRWSLFWPFACTSIPFAYIGGHLTLPIEIYRIAIGITLLLFAMRLLIRAPLHKNEFRHPSTVVSLSMGATLGLISGLIGVGGGIFLSPLLILMGWAGIKETAAVAAVFVLVNSASGLLGHMNAAQNIPPMALVIAAAAVCGGITGSYFGSRRLPLLTVQRALSMVLCIAGYKLIFV
ncbi:MAG TPA: sulfite exporter TauE/SafE family protein [Syntrophales bacterium]|nr:sulfite exporter TauE/SafE family protein [Syntrophales bacterium]